MAKTDNLTDFLTGVAGAIRTKKGTIALINPQDFESEIGSIDTAKPEQTKTLTVTENGTQTVKPDTGKVLSGVTVTTNVPATPTEEKTVDLNMTSGNQVITPTSGKVISKATIKKPATMIPANIRKDVNIGGVVGSMEAGAFDGLIDGSITNFVMPADKTQIAQCRFYGFENLISVDLGNVENIGDYAFYRCVNLTSITLPETTKDIGDNAFADDYNVTHLSGTIDGNVGYSAFGNLSKVSECDCSNFNIHFLGDYAFSGFGDARTNPSQNLLVVDLSKSDFDKIPEYCFGTINPPNIMKYMRFTFPNTVKSIDHYAFSYVDHCDFYFTSSTPPTLSATTVWYYITNSKIFVPYGSLNAYKTATNWTTQASNIIGYVGAGVLPVGSELPMLGAEGYALTWFSDKACTISATTVENADTTYYCTIGTEKNRLRS